MKRAVGGSSAVAVLLLCLAPRAGAGEEAGPPAAKGSLLVEREQSGFVIAPDFKFARLDGQFANLAGVYGGWMTDRTLLIGGGAYVLTNRSDDFETAYGGLVVEWHLRGNRRFGFGVRGLLGGGEATLSADANDLVRGPRRAPFVRFGRGRRVLPSDRSVVVRDDFFIAEPQLNAELRLTRRLRLSAGASYRLIGGSRALDDRLRGVAGTLGLQFGGG